MDEAALDPLINAWSTSLHLDVPKGRETSQRAGMELSRPVRRYSLNVSSTLCGAHRVLTLCLPCLGV